MAQKKKVEVDEFEKELSACEIKMRESINGQVASLKFRGKDYSASAANQLSKREQKKIAVKILLNSVRANWYREKIE